MKVPKQNAPDVLLARLHSHAEAGGAAAVDRDADDAARHAAGVRGLGGHEGGVRATVPEAKKKKKHETQGWVVWLAEGGKGSTKGKACADLQRFAAQGYSGGQRRRGRGI